MKTSESSPSKLLHFLLCWGYRVCFKMHIYIKIVTNSSLITYIYMITKNLNLQHLFWTRHCQITNSILVSLIVCILVRRCYVFLIASSIIAEPQAFKSYMGRTIRLSEVLLLLLELFPGIWFFFLFLVPFVMGWNIHYVCSLSWGMSSLTDK